MPAPTFAIAASRRAHGRLPLVAGLLCLLALACDRRPAHAQDPLHPHPQVSRGSSPSLKAAGSQPKMPSFDAVQQMVERRFATEIDYEPGDLISRSQVEATLADIARLGWQVPDRKSILNHTLDDRDFFLVSLRTPAGKKFMRALKQEPEGYQAADRLSRLSDGHKLLPQLIRGPDGHKLIEYMTNTQGGRNLEKQLARTPGGKPFQQPTGRIYTEEQLIQRLKASYLSPPGAAAGRPSEKAF